MCSSLERTSSQGRAASQTGTSCGNRKPLMQASVVGQIDRLVFEIGLDAVTPLFAADAAFLHAAERNHGGWSGGCC